MWSILNHYIDHEIEHDIDYDVDQAIYRTVAMGGIHSRSVFPVSMPMSRPLAIAAMLGPKLWELPCFLGALALVDDVTAIPASGSGFGADASDADVVVSFFALGFSA